MVDLCPLCGKNRVLVGLRHLCVPVTKMPAPVTKSTKPRRGRPLIGKGGMTGAERVRRHRQQRKGGH